MKLENVLSINTRSGEEMKEILQYKFLYARGFLWFKLVFVSFNLQSSFLKVYVYSIPSEGYLHRQLCKSMFSFSLDLTGSVYFLPSHKPSPHIYNAV